MDAKDIINFNALSEQLTGSPSKIRKNNTGEKYVEDVEELIQYIDLWLKWKSPKYMANKKK